MKLKVFVGSTLSVLVTVLASPASAQGTPSGDDRRPENSGPASEPPAPPDPSPTSPAAAPQDASPSLPPPETPTPEPSTPSGAVAPASTTADPVEGAATGPAAKIGAVLSPLLITTGLGYAYASVTHPQLISRSMSGAFLEISAGTELDPRFRLSLAFTSFETKIRRVGGGNWEEGEFQRIARSGLGAQKDPVDPQAAEGGGSEVQKTLHVHSIAPRMDFLPLGSQGPYLGMTAGVAVIQDLSPRIGANLGARIGGEWRPFQAFAVAIEAGAHGQIYADAKAAIPYALARITLLLEVTRQRSTGSAPAPMMIPMQRTLPAPSPR